MVQLISEAIMALVKKSSQFASRFFFSFNCKIIHSRYHPPVIPYKTFSNKKKLTTRMNRKKLISSKYAMWLITQHFTKIMQNLRVSAKKLLYPSLFIAPVVKTLSSKTDTTRIVSQFCFIVDIFCYYLLNGTPTIFQVILWILLLEVLF